MLWGKYLADDKLGIREEHGFILNSAFILSENGFLGSLEIIGNIFQGITQADGINSLAFLLPDLTHDPSVTTGTGTANDLLNLFVCQSLIPDISYYLFVLIHNMDFLLFRVWFVFFTHSIYYINAGGIFAAKEKFS